MAFPAPFTVVGSPRKALDSVEDSKMSLLPQV